MTFAIRGTYDSKAPHKKIEQATVKWSELKPKNVSNYDTASHQ